MDSNKSLKGLKRCPSWIKVDRKKNLFFTIYWLYHLSKLIINLILQCVNLTLQGSIERERNPKVISKLQADIKWVQNMMVNLGQIHRASGASGILFYSLCISAILTYNLLGLLFGGKVFDFFSNSETLMFLARPEKDKEVVSKRIHNCLDYMIYSNKNYTKKIVDRVITDDDNDTESSSESDWDNTGHDILEQRKKIIKRIKTTPNLQADIDERSQLSLNRMAAAAITSTDSLNVSKSAYLDIPKFAINHINIPRSSHLSVSKSANMYKFRHSNNNNNGKESVDFEMISAEVELIEALGKQREFMIKLKSNIEKVWPPSKNNNMIDKLKRIGSVTLCIYASISWFYGETICISAFQIAHKSLLKSSFDQEYRSFTLLDRITCFEHHIFTYFIMLSYIPQFSVYLVTTLNHLEQLKSLWSKTNKFYEGVKRCEMWQQRSEYYLNKKDLLLTEQSRKDLRFECDKSILELYINYYVFRQEVQSAIKASGTAADQLIATIIIALIPVLAYFKYIPESHLSSLMTIVMIMILICNLPFILCAFFDSSCNRFAKHAWSILAFAAGHNYELHLSSKSTSSTNIFKRRNIDYIGGNDHSSGSISSEQGIKRMPDYVYYSKSFILPHSVILWHSLIKSHRTVSDSFVSKLFRIFKVNYSGILKFNHWLVWASLTLILIQ